MTAAKPKPKKHRTVVCGFCAAPVPYQTGRKYLELQRSAREGCRWVRERYNWRAQVADAGGDEALALRHRDNEVERSKKRAQHRLWYYKPTCGAQECVKQQTAYRKARKNRADAGGDEQCLSCKDPVPKFRLVCSTGCGRKLAVQAIRNNLTFELD